MALKKEDAGLTFEEIERKYGIVETRDDIPEHFLGKPPSSYYTDKEADFEGARERTDAILAKFDAYLELIGS